MESTMEAGTCLCEKLLGNLAVNMERGGRVEWPPLYINVTCCNEPWRERQSCRDTVDEDDDKESTLISSFNCFLSRRKTMWRSRYHKKQRYLTVDAKYLPFFSMGCQGTPRGDIMQKNGSKVKIEALGRGGNGGK